MVTQAVNEGQKAAVSPDTTNVGGKAAAAAVMANESADSMGAADDRKNEKRDAMEPHYDVHEEKVVTIVKNIPVPIQITKHVPYPVEKLVRRHHILNEIVSLKRRAAYVKTKGVFIQRYLWKLKSHALDS